MEEACLRLLDSSAFELPAVAVYRKTALERLAFRIECLGGGGSGRGRGGANEAASRPRKLAWDVVNKIVWKRLSAKKSLGGRKGGERPSGERPSGERLSGERPSGERLSGECSTSTEDPVLPPHVSIEALASRLRSAFTHAAVSDKDIANVARDFSKAASDLCAFAERQQLLWRQRARLGRPFTDRVLGVTCQAHPSDSKLCQLQFSDQGEVVETVELWKAHVEALRGLHRGHRQRSAAASAIAPGSSSLDDRLEAGLVHTRIFTMALRYDALSGCKCAYQAALPPPVMELLKAELGCAHECYASPLNQYLGAFCSAFADTDAAFGSAGSFFDFRPAEGSFECNPPFDSRSIDACLEHVLALLRGSSSERPLSFVVTVPTLDGTHSDAKGSAYRGLEAYRSAAVEVRAKDHSYLMGLQHRRQIDGVYWHPDIPSTAYVFQNAAGRLRWPVRGTFAEKLRRAWDWRGK